MARRVNPAGVLDDLRDDWISKRRLALTLAIITLSVLVLAALLIVAQLILPSVGTAAVDLTIGGVWTKLKRDAQAAKNEYLQFYNTLK